MPDFITFTSKEISPKGLRPNTLLIEEKIKSYFFSGEYEKLELLNTLTVPLQKKEPRLLYPGCGTDILTPLLYLEKLFADVKKWDLIYVDTSNTFDILKTILDDVGVFFEEKKDSTLLFYWKDILVTLQFFEQDIFTSIGSFTDFDVYFEKAFCIMKDREQSYEPTVYGNLSQGGEIISDSGFRGLGLKTIPVPSSLSSYGEMIIGMKKKLL